MIPDRKLTRCRVGPHHPRTTREGRHVIPEAAVEAAAYALYVDANPDTETQWFDITFHEQDELIRTATKALEAAAPHMLSGGWASAYAAGFSNAADGKDYNAIDTNPYRHTK